jgi:antitoxin HicB
MLRYPIKLEPDDNGTFLVTCPALPEVTTFGEDEADGLRRALGAIEEALAARIADSVDIPAPPARRDLAVVLPLMTTLKVSLYRALREAGITIDAAARLESRVGGSTLPSRSFITSGSDRSGLSGARKVSQHFD